MPCPRFTTNEYFSKTVEGIRVILSTSSFFVSGKMWSLVPRRLSARSKSVYSIRVELMNLPFWNRLASRVIHAGNRFNGGTRRMSMSPLKLN